MARDYKLNKTMQPVDDTTENLRSPDRVMIELRMEHADLDSLIDRTSLAIPLDELSMRRLKKRRLLLRDRIARLEADIDPPVPA